MNVSLVATTSSMFARSSSAAASGGASRRGAHAPTGAAWRKLGGTRPAWHEAARQRHKERGAG